jgi:hypothetical protein
VVGCFLCHSVACSYAWASCKTTASPPCGPLICKPTGSPLRVNPQGTDIVGIPYLSKGPVLRSIILLMSEGFSWEWHIFEGCVEIGYGWRRYWTCRRYDRVHRLEGPLNFPAQALNLSTRQYVVPAANTGCYILRGYAIQYGAR